MGARTQFSGKVTAAWLGKGVWLSEAAKLFGARQFALMCEEAARKFAELRDGQTPETFIRSSSLSGPERDRELRDRLSGEQRQAWVEYYAARNALQRDMEFKLTWGYLLAFGAPGSAAATPEWIPVQAWFHLHVDYQTKDVVRGEGMSYWYVRVVDRAAAEGGAAKKPRPPLETVKGWVREMFARPGPAPKSEAEVIPECMRRGATEDIAKQASKEVREELGLKLGRPPKIRAE